jgi:hypothetical protein
MINTPSIKTKEENDDAGLIDDKEYVSNKNENMIKIVIAPMTRIYALMKN